jgi:DNA-binding MarR family transcriptional regulator
MIVPFCTEFEYFDFRRVGVMVTRRQAVADLGAAMQRYQRSVQAYDDAVGRALGLGPADLRCLDWLVDGPKTAGHLATATGLRPAATTALVDRLQARGLVERIPDEHDRRRVLVRMTDEGMRSTYTMYAPLVDEGQSLLSRHTVAELAAARDLLDAMREMTDRHRERLSEPG